MRLLAIFAFAVALHAAPARLKSLTCTPMPPSGLTSGKSGICTITLTKPAPKGGLQFKITDFTKIPFGAPVQLTVPSMLVTVPWGNITWSFTITQK